jgi:hypothetical protein
MLFEVKIVAWTGPEASRGDMSLPMSAKSLELYRQCSAARIFHASTLIVRSSADAAICAKPLTR